MNHTSPFTSGHHTLLFIVLLLCGSCSRETIYIVRHAEKQTMQSTNPALTANGLKRAQDLALLLKAEPLAAIYSTNTIRTVSTVQPTADQKKLQIMYYDSIPQLVELLKNPKGNCLVAGHSNTILDIARALGANPVLQTIEDNDYDNLLIVTRHKSIFGTSLKLQETVYGAASP